MSAAPILNLLATPLVAAILGIAAGAGALALTAAGARLFTPETLELGMARALVLATAGIVAAFALLLLYFVFMRAGLVPFGLGLVCGFIVPALIALFRTSGIAKSSTARR